ncbi:MAG: sulfite exporter TauE/SafE family protein [Oligoflexia bacterium]|nr:sulfite exporter TauE/SafE family protein [Oligoflexia bacterium]
MLDQLSNLGQQSILMAFALVLFTGVTGSLHCVGMCGGLVMASTHNMKSNGLYQFGRLLGYLILGFFAGAIGSYIKDFLGEKLSLVLPAVAIGLLFISYSLKSFNLQLPIRLPKAFKINTQGVLSRAMFLKSAYMKSFSVGFLSMLLPCGLLYGVAMAVGALQSPYLGMLAMSFFWLGTLPGLAFAPSIIKKVFKPIAIKYPRSTSLVFLSIGILTITVRIYNVYGQQAASCH